MDQHLISTYAAPLNGSIHGHQESVGIDDEALEYHQNATHPILSSFTIDRKTFGIGVVNGMEQSDLRDRFVIFSYPAMKMYRRSDAVYSDYKGLARNSTIVRWILRLWRSMHG